MKLRQPRSVNASGPQSTRSGTSTVTVRVLGMVQAITSTGAWVMALVGTTTVGTTAKAILSVKVTDMDPLTAVVVAVTRVVPSVSRVSVAEPVPVVGMATVMGDHPRLERIFATDTRRSKL
jgi:hypothetical protein